MPDSIHTSTLTHKVLDDSVENWSLEVKRFACFAYALLASAESTKIFSSLWNNILKLKYAKMWVVGGTLYTCYYICLYVQVQTQCDLQVGHQFQCQRIWVMSKGQFGSRGLQVLQGSQVDLHARISHCYFFNYSQFVLAQCVNYWQMLPFYIALDSDCKMSFGSFAKILKSNVVVFIFCKEKRVWTEIKKHHSSKVEVREHL